MEKTISINGKTINLFIVQVFDDKFGHINEHILAVDLSNIYYQHELINELLVILKKDHPALKPVFFTVGSDNYNNVYISAIGGVTEDHPIKEINQSKAGYEKYNSTIAGLHSKY